MHKLFIVAVFGVLLSFPVSVQAASLEELQAQLAALLKQVAALQGQISEKQNSCASFSRDLWFGDGGPGAVGTEPDVRLLQQALEAEGFSINASEKKGGSVFGESTAAAVVGFQEKYRADILTPNGLAYGTGYVGAATRAKLTKLFRCGTSGSPATPSISSNGNPTIKVVYPNGGEKLTNTPGGVLATIRWRSENLNGKDVSIVLVDSKGDSVKVIAGAVDDTGSMIWYHDPALRDGKYKLEINTDDKGPTTGDQSDSYFTISGNEGVGVQSFSASPDSGESPLKVKFTAKIGGIEGPFWINAEGGSAWMTKGSCRKGVCTYTSSRTFEPLVSTTYQVSLYTGCTYATCVPGTTPDQFLGYVLVGVDIEEPDGTPKITGGWYESPTFGGDGFVLSGENFTEGSYLVYENMEGPGEGKTGSLAQSGFRASASRITFGNNSYTENTKSLYEVRVIDKKGRESNAFLIDTRISY